MSFPWRDPRPLRQIAYVGTFLVASIALHAAVIYAQRPEEANAKAEPVKVFLREMAKNLQELVEQAQALPEEQPPAEQPPPEQPPVEQPPAKQPPVEQPPPEQPPPEVPLEPEPKPEIPQELADLDHRSLEELLPPLPETLPLDPKPEPTPPKPEPEPLPPEPQPEPLPPEPEPQPEPLPPEPEPLPPEPEPEAIKPVPLPPPPPKPEPELVRPRPKPPAAKPPEPKRVAPKPQPKPRRPLPPEIGSESKSARDARIAKSMRELDDFARFATDQRDPTEGPLPGLFLTNEDEEELLEIMAHFDLLPIAYRASEPSKGYIALDLIRRSFTPTTDFSYLEERYSNKLMAPSSRMLTSPMFRNAARGIAQSFGISGRDLQIGFAVPRPFMAYLNWKAFQTCREQGQDPAEVQVCQGRLVRSGNTWILRVERIILRDGAVTMVRGA